MQKNIYLDTFIHFQSLYPTTASVLPGSAKISILLKPASPIHYSQSL